MAEPAERPPFPDAPAKNMEHPAPSTPGGDPLASGASVGDVGGPRIYTGPGLGQLVAWKCPACGNENSGRLDSGCVHCGSGSAKPAHVGVPPVRPGKGLDRIGSGIWEGDAVRPAVQTPQPLIVGFDDWCRARGGVPTEIEIVLREAWIAAIDWYRATLRAQPPPRVELSGTEVAEEDLSRVKVPRILVQRVIATLEATFDLPEEQQSADLLSIIAELREILE